MIKKKEVILKSIIQKDAYCDNCDEKLIEGNSRLLSSPPKLKMICPKCKKTYYIDERELTNEYNFEEIKEDPLQN